jgi:hypothetical protein
VTHEGSTYQAVRDTGQGVTHADWVCIAHRGADAISPNVRGTYDAYEKYERLDIVALDGATFIAKCNDPGVCPGEGWQLMARQGKAGRPGLPGERGLRGEKGEQGEPGAEAPEIVSWQIDRNLYRASPLMSNGKIGKPLELRGLFERFLEETRE